MKKAIAAIFPAMFIIFLCAWGFMATEQRGWRAFKVKEQNIERHAKSDLIHICTDTTHATCDNECTCDGMECK